MSHYDKDTIKSRVKISQYLDDQGVKVCNSRAIASWRGGKNPNVAISDEKGVWHDFKTGEGGDIFALFQHIEGGDFKTALNTLGKRYDIQKSKDGVTAPTTSRPHYPSGPRLKKEELEEVNRQLLPETARTYVRSLIGGMDWERATADWVREMSPCLDWIGQPPSVQTALFFRSAFAPDELLFVFRDGHRGTNGRIGDNIRPAREWASMAERGELRQGCLVKTNPFTGAEGQNADRKPSFVSADCMADYPFALLEFDDMPLKKQVAFWRGFLLVDPRAPALVSLTYSGDRSIHGLLHVGCRTRKDWDAVRARLVSLYRSDGDEHYRTDIQALHPLIGTRLAGLVRPKTGKRQTLLYLNPEARGVTGWKETADGPLAAQAKGFVSR